MRQQIRQAHNRDAYQSFPGRAARTLYRSVKFLFQLSAQAEPEHRPVTGRDRHETRRRHCGNHEARGDRDPLRLSGQSPDRVRRQRRHPPGDGAAGAHRPAHGGRDLARHLRAHHRRVLHAARPRRGERHGRRRAMLRRIRAGAGAADGLCAAARQYRSELQFQPGDAGVRQIGRADQYRRRSLQHLPPRLHQAEERPRRAGDRRNPGRHVERGSAGAAELHAGAAHPLRRRSRARQGSRGAAGRRQAAGDLCRPGRALRQGLAAAEAAGRTARHSRHHQPRRQVVLPGRRIRCRSAPAASRCRARCRNSSPRPT